MIGTLISMKYIGKKSWSQSLVFWLVYIVATAILSSIVNLGIILGAVVFILLAKYWYKMDWFLGIKTFAVAFVIDIIIAVVLVGILLVAFGLALPGVIEEFIESAFLLG